ncbi:MAG: hypothetical protein AAF889_00110 [Cyanobacteria bacterium P01_D01_bin.73]
MALISKETVLEHASPGAIVEGAIEIPVDGVVYSVFRLRSTGGTTTWHAWKGEQKIDCSGCLNVLDVASVLFPDFKDRAARNLMSLDWMSRNN